MVDWAEVSREPHGDGRRVVLVVEDDMLIRADIAAYLRDAGFVVIEAATGEEAMVTLGARGGIDIVFCDLRLEGAMDGLALARWAERHSGLPVLLTSAEGAAVVPPRFRHAQFIAKPYSPAEVVRRLRRLLGES